jgi:hypothetical protein
MTRDPLTLHARDYGELLLALVLEAQIWVLRRVETLRIEDDNTVNVRVSTDYDLTLTEAGETYTDLLAEGALPRLLLPLGFLAKKPLHDFSLTNQDGKAVSFLSQEETAPISIAALESLAEDLLDVDELPQVVREFIVNVVEADEIEGEQLILEVETVSAGRSDWLAMTTLWAHPEFKYVATNLARSFIAIASLPKESAEIQRCIIKYAYVTTLPWNWSSVGADDVRLIDAVLVRMALRPAQASLDIPLVSNSRSYHVDVEAPANLELRSASIEQSREGIVKTLRKYKGKFTRAHLNVREGSYGTVFEHKLILQVAPQRRGFVRDAMAATLFSFIALLAVFYFVRQGSHSATSVPIPAITIIPGLLAAYLSRPTEHPLASRLYFGLRCVLALSALLAWLAAAITVINVTDAVLEAGLAGLCVASLACVLIAVAAYRAATGVAGAVKEM